MCSWGINSINSGTFYFFSSSAICSSSLLFQRLAFKISFYAKRSQEREPWPIHLFLRIYSDKLQPLRPETHTKSDKCQSFKFKGSVPSFRHTVRRWAVHVWDFRYPTKQAWRPLKIPGSDVKALCHSHSAWGHASPWPTESHCIAHLGCCYPGMCGYKLTALARPSQPFFLWTPEAASNLQSREIKAVMGHVYTHLTQFRLPTGWALRRTELCKQNTFPHHEKKKTHLPSTCLVSAPNDLLSTLVRWFKSPLIPMRQTKLLSPL